MTYVEGFVKNKFAAIFIIFLFSINSYADDLSDKLSTCSIDERELEYNKYLRLEWIRYKKNFKGQKDFPRKLPFKKLSDETSFKLKGKREEIVLINKMVRIKLGNMSSNRFRLCETTWCALTKLIENGDILTTLKMINLYHETGIYFEISSHKPIWEKAYIIKFIDTYRKLPRFFQHLPFAAIRISSRNQILLGEKNVLAYSVPGAGIGDFINIDGVLKFRPQTLEDGHRTDLSIAHEIAHQVDNYIYSQKNDEMIRLGGYFSQSVGYMALSGWIQNNDNWSFNKSNKCYISWYSETHPTEEFAEIFSNYIQHPKQLYEKCKRHYMYFKEIIFKGIEYKKISPWMSIKDFLPVAINHCLNKDFDKPGSSYSEHVDQFANLFLSLDGSSNTNCLKELKRITYIENNNLTCAERDYDIAKIYKRMLKILKYKLLEVISNHTYVLLHSIFIEQECKHDNECYYKSILGPLLTNAERSNNILKNINIEDFEKIMHIIYIPHHLRRSH